MKNKLEREICDRLTIIERRLDNALSRQLKEQSDSLKPYDYEDAWKSWEEEPEKGGMTDEEYNKFFNLNKQQERDWVKYATEKYEEWGRTRAEYLGGTIEKWERGLDQILSCYTWYTGKVGVEGIDIDENRAGELRNSLLRFIQQLLVVKELEVWKLSKLSEDKNETKKAQE
jgi:hypothetical protein